MKLVIVPPALAELQDSYQRRRPGYWRGRK
jgi:hypothetical protein